MTRDGEILEMISIDSSPVDGGILDLSANPMFSSKIKEIESIKIVSRDLSGRPVAIMKAIYGSAKYLDLFFSLNGFSNPMTVKEGDKLVVPPLLELSSNVGRGLQQNRAIEETEKRVAKQDAKRLKFLGVGKLKQPNQNESRTNFVEQPNRVISLGNVSDSKDAFVEIKNRINIKNTLL